MFHEEGWHHEEKSSLTRVKALVRDFFKGIDSPVRVARYHSLAVKKDSLPDCLFVTAETADGEIMAVRHKEFPVYGLQFHPESIYTEHGKRMIENFLSQ